MILKIVSLFLIAMVVLAMFGKLRVPKLRALTCKTCGAHKIGKTCQCNKKA